MDVTKAAKESASEISRLPLGPCEKNTNASHRTRVREVASRHRTQTPTTTHKRSPSPMLPTTSRDCSLLVSRRAQSTERKRPSSSSGVKPLQRHSSIDTHFQSRRLSCSIEGLWPSMNSLSNSSQSDTISAPITQKEKPPLDAPFRVPSKKQNESTLRGKNASDQCGMLTEQKRCSTRIGGKLSSSKSLVLSDHSEKSFASSKELLDSLLTNFPDKISPSSSSSAYKVSSSRSRNSSPAKSCGSRGVSPVRSRPSTPPSSGRSPSKGMPTQQTNSSVLTFMVDVKKGKKGASHVEEIHHLRLLYNRYLQWRFVNAKADAIHKTQKLTAEKLLQDVREGIVRLMASVNQTRIALHKLRLELKVHTILSGQTDFLDRWRLLEGDHTDAVIKAVADLQAATYRVPVIEGAKVDEEILRAAISSAVDVMQLIVSFITIRYSNAQKLDGLMCELTNVTAAERLMVDHCESLLSSFSALQMECSLRTQLIQVSKESRCRHAM